jgi:hypothetical protein
MKFTELETESKDIFLSKEIHSTKRAKQISRDYQKRKYSENRDELNTKRRMKRSKHKYNYDYEDLQAEYLMNNQVKVYSQSL